MNSFSNNEKGKEKSNRWKRTLREFHCHLSISVTSFRNKSFIGRQICFHMSQLLSPQTILPVWVTLHGKIQNHVPFFIFLIAIFLTLWLEHVPICIPDPWVLQLWSFSSFCPAALSALTSLHPCQGGLGFLYHLVPSVPKQRSESILKARRTYIAFHIQEICNWDTELYAKSRIIKNERHNLF